MNLDPDVSVIIPCFNQAKYLPDAIESVLSQTHRRFEIVVVDDGSTDGSSAVAAQFPEARCMRQSNQGLANARNFGISQSSGSYLIFLDADDRLLNHALATGLAAFAEHPECGFVYGRFQRISEDGKKLATGQPARVLADHYRYFLNRNFISPGSAMFRRNAIKNVGGFNPEVDACADYDLYLRMARVLPVFSHDQLITERRIHQTQMSRNSVLMLEQVLEVLAWQWPYVENDPALREAYLIGRQHYQKWYGEQIVTEAYLLESQNLREEALPRIAALKRNYPEGYAAYDKGLRRSNTAVFPVLTKAPRGQETNQSEGRSGSVQS